MPYDTFLLKSKLTLLLHNEMSCRRLRFNTFIHVLLHDFIQMVLPNHY